MSNNKIIDAGTLITGSNGIYKVENHLGRGSVCRVYEGVFGTAKYALKVFRPNSCYKRDYQNELLIMLNLKSATKMPEYADLIVKMHDYMAFVRCTDNSVCVYPCIVFDLLGDSLEDALSNIDCAINVDVARVIFADICRGLAFLHENNIIHGDLSVNNVMFKNKVRTSKDLVNNGVKLSDFNLSIMQHAPIKASGTTGFTAPEIILKQQVTPTIDIFSAASILFEMITFNILFDEDESKDSDHTHEDQNDVDIKCSYDDNESSRSSSYSSDREDSYDTIIRTHEMAYKYLRMIETVVGEHPPAYMMNSEEGRKYYTNGCLLYETRQVEKFNMIGHLKKSGVQSAAKISALIISMVQFDPQKRPSAVALLAHPFTNRGRF